MKNKIIKIICVLASTAAIFASFYGVINHYENRVVEYETKLEDKDEEMKHKVEAVEKLAEETMADLKAENESMKTTIDDLKQVEGEFVYLGKFKTTYYCNEPYKHICGYGKRMTASGAPTDVGTTIAVDTKVIPFGTEVYIDGVGWRTAQDRGGAVKGNHIDILVDGHQEALHMGNPDRDVWVLAKNS